MRSRCRGAPVPPMTHDAVPDRDRQAIKGLASRADEYVPAERGPSCHAGAWHPMPASARAPLEGFRIIERYMEKTREFLL